MIIAQTSACDGDTTITADGHDAAGGYFPNYILGLSLVFMRKKESTAVRNSLCIYRNL